MVLNITLPTVMSLVTVMSRLVSAPLVMTSPVVGTVVGELNSRLISELSIVVKDLQTHQSSLEDIFVKLVSEPA